MAPIVTPSTIQRCRYDAERIHRPTAAAPRGRGPSGSDAGRRPAGPRPAASSQVPARAPVLFGHFTRGLAQVPQRIDDPAPGLGGDGGDELFDLGAPASRHRVDQAPATRGQRDADLTPVAPIGPARHQALLDQAVAHPRRGGRRDRDRLGQSGHTLGAPEASTTNERYWVKVTSSPTSASERAAMATSTRLALRTASTR